MAKERYKDALNDVLTKVLSNPEAQSSLEKKKYSSISNLTASNAKSYKDYYSRVTQQCDTNIDALCNVINYYVDGPSALGSTSNKAQKIRVRDARNANQKKPENTPDSWIQAMASQARAVSILLENVDNPPVKSKDKIEEEVYKLFTDHSKLLNNGIEISASERKDVVDHFSYEIVSVLKQDDSITVNGKNIASQDIKKIGKILNDVRDFGNFEEDSHHTMTITPKIGKDGSNILWFSGQMNPVSEEITKEYTENLVGKIWYQKLTPLQKKLVVQYSDQIISGDHIIPTQLRYLPGLKNCYMDMYGTVENVKRGELHLAPHSGTMVQDAGQQMSNEVDRITQMQINHAKNLVKSEGFNHMRLQVLNSTGIGSRQLDPTDRNICFTMDRLAANDKEIVYKRSGINSFAESDPLENVDDIAKMAVDVENDRKSGGSNSVLWAKCKSGKDRTFMVLFNNMTSILGGEDYKKKREIADSLLYSNHAETMASSAGGSRGAVGLKLGGTYVRLFGTDIINPINPTGAEHVLGGNTAKHWKNKISYVNLVHPVQNQKISDRVSLYTPNTPGINKTKVLNVKERGENIHSLNNTTASPKYPANQQYKNQNTHYPDAYPETQINYNHNVKANNARNWAIVAGVFMGLLAGGPVGAVIGGGLAYSLSKDTKVGVGPIIAIGITTIVASAFIGPAALVIPVAAYGVAKYSAIRAKGKQNIQNLHNNSKSVNHNGIAYQRQREAGITPKVQKQVNGNRGRG